MAVSPELPLEMPVTLAKWFAITAQLPSDIEAEVGEAVKALAICDAAWSTAVSLAPPVEVALTCEKLCASIL